jgi:hypothetical protein
VMALPVQHRAHQQRHRDRAERNEHMDVRPRTPAATNAETITRH